MALPLTLVVSSYESAAFTYVCVVCIYIFYKYVIKEKEGSKGKWVIDGLTFAVPLVIAVLLRIIIGVCLIWILGLQYAPNGGTSIYWTNGFISTLISLLARIAGMYVVHALVYLPIRVFLLAAILFFIGTIVIGVRQHRILPVILGIIVILSVFSQSIFQGHAMTYRTAQTLSIFAAFMAAVIVELSCMARRRGVKIVVVGAALLLCLHQGVYINQLLALNNQRSDNEMAVAHQIGYRLKSQYDDKTVVFVGEYDMGDWIKSQVNVDTSTLSGKIYEKIFGFAGKYVKGDYAMDDLQIVRTNVNSVLNWSSHAFDSQEFMKEYFSYCGYDIKVLQDYPEEVKKEYDRIAKEEGLRPFEIRDMGDYIFVCLGEIE